MVSVSEAAVKETNNPHILIIKAREALLEADPTLEIRYFRCADNDRTTSCNWNITSESATITVSLYNFRDIINTATKSLGIPESSDVYEWRKVSIFNINGLVQFQAPDHVLQATSANTIEVKIKRGQTQTTYQVTFSTYLKQIQPTSPLTIALYVGEGSVPSIKDVKAHHVLQATSGNTIEDCCRPAG